MAVEEYDQKFDVLSHFSPDMVETELARVEKFVRGMRKDF